MKRIYYLHRFLCILLLLFSFSATTLADGVKGRVIDAETKQPIADANVQLVITVGASRTTSSQSTDSLGNFTLLSFLTGRAVISISFLGYKTYTKAEYLFSIMESNDTIDLGDIELKHSSTMLKAVEVTGHLPKITMSGDTIVFNPEAIKLEDNAKIIELLRKLPGVSQHDDGSLYWNNKPIRLMMNGKDVFSEGMISQLPADIVKKLKLYDRGSKLARHTGVSDGKEDNVLDIQIKPGFMDKFFSTAEAQYLTTNHYKAHTNGMRLSDTTPIMFLLDANNINETWKMKANSTSSSGNYNFGKGLFGGISFGHNWMTEGAEDNNNIAFGPYLGHHDEWTDSHSSTQNYFPNEEQTFTLNRAHTYKHNLSPSIDFQTDIYTDSVNEVYFEANYTYTKSHTKDENLLTRYDEEPYAFGSFPIEETFNAQPGTALFNHTLLRSRDRSLANNDQNQIKLSSQWSHFLPDEKGEFDLSAESELNSSNERQLINRNYDYLQRQPSIGINQWGRNPMLSANNSIKSEIQYTFSDKFLLDLSETVGYNFNRNNIDFYADSLSDAPADYHPLNADIANRLRSHQNTFYNTVEASLVYSFSKHNTISPSITWSWYHDHLDYQRGSLDTVATRSTHLIAPSLIWSFKIDRTQSVNLGLSYKNTQPELTQKLNYADSRNPLSIERGNPNLRNSGTYEASGNYTKFFPRQQIMLNTVVDFVHESSPLSYLMAYNSQTGGYTMMPINVKGGNQLEVEFNYEQSFGPFFTFRNRSKATWQRSYAYLTITDVDQPLSRNTERGFTFNDNLDLAYETENFQTSLYGRLTANNYHYTLTPAFDNKPLDFTYGLKTWVKMNKIKFSSDISDEFHCGYLSSSINRHRCIWNASVSLSVLKNLGTLTLGMDDILNQRNNYSSNVGAYQRVESWNDVYSHYAYLKFEYNIRPKKKK